MKTGLEGECYPFWAIKVIDEVHPLSEEHINIAKIAPVRVGWVGGQGGVMTHDIHFHSYI